jgi:hypothetical protein
MLVHHKDVTIANTADEADTAVSELDPPQSLHIVVIANDGTLHSVE